MGRVAKVVGEKGGTTCPFANGAVNATCGAPHQYVIDKLIAHGAELADHRVKLNWIFGTTILTLLSCVGALVMLVFFSGRG